MYPTSRWRGILLGALLSVACIAPAMAQDSAESESDASPLAALPWQKGPGRQPVTDKATIALNDDQMALDNLGTQDFLRMSGNLPDDKHWLILDSAQNWWAVFSYDDIGYVKDDEQIDADDLLKTMKDSDEPANKVRLQQGLTPIYTDGWSTPPHYDTQNKRLEWGLRIRDDKGNTNLNYTIRLLGRKGVISATLVTDAESFESDIAGFRKTLEGFDYNSGEKYSEFTSGDKVAAVGLGALVLGGAAAIATKKGWWAAIALFLAKAWKLALVAVVALGAGIRKLLGRKKKDTDDDAAA